ncbi:MAG: hypothetical protein QNK37_08320 [Acidobacteriota bacterium]|nr:hypothetical protein [Acidobacteriota bacterium]
MKVTVIMQFHRNGLEGASVARALQDYFGETFDDIDQALQAYADQLTHDDEESHDDEPSANTGLHRFTLKDRAA